MSSFTMPRRVVDSEEDEHTNDETMLEVKPDPSQSNKKRALTPDDDDDEADELADSQEAEQAQEEADDQPATSIHDGEEDEENEENVSSHGRKRARLDEAGSSKATVKDENAVRRQTLPRAEDGYVPGSIVRMTLKSFMTYDNCEFRPGAHLNMVIGPNGTGKSSIASAICLGLGWPPGILNRASGLQAFVKHGADTAVIEIELRGARNEKNLIIKRTLHSHNNTSIFHLNGKQVAANEVKEKVGDLNVQVGNLCSFLPQDRVSEFAQMTPQQLLIETQKAAGSSGLTKWHEKLIEFGADLKKLKNDMKEDQGTVDNEQARNDILEKEVERYRQRREIERKIELLELQIPFAQYAIHKKEYDRLKLERARIGAELQQLEEEDSPLLDFIKKQEGESKKCERDRKRFEEDARKKMNTMRKEHDEYQKAEEASEEATNLMSLIKKNARERRTRIENLRKDIDKLQAEIDNPPDLSPLEGLQEERRNLNVQVAEINNRKADWQSRQVEYANQNAMRKAEIDRANIELKRLDDVSMQRISNLHKWDKDCADTIMWLRNDNQKRFAMEVMEPAIISLTVPDGRYTDMVESCFNANDIKTFVCQCEEDSRLLNKLVNDTDEALGRKGRVNVWWRPKIMGQLTPPPISREEATQLGFDGFVIDYVECPDPLLWFLKKQLSMHRTAVARNAASVDPATAAEAVSGPNAPPATFILGRVSFTVSRSRYGRRLPQQTTRDLKQARNLAHVAVDQQKIAEWTDRRAAARQAIDEHQPVVQELAQEEKRIKDDTAEVSAKLKENTKAKDVIQRASAAWQGAKLKLNEKQRRLEGEEKAPSGDEERKKLKAKLLTHARMRTEYALKYTQLAKEACDLYAQATRAGLKLSQIQCNITYLKKLDSQQTEAKKKAQEEFAKIQATFLVAKGEAHRWLAKSKAVLDTVDAELRETFQTIQKEVQHTLEALEDDLQAERAKLDMNMAADEGVIERYERRKATIDKLRERMAQKEKKVAKLEDDVRKTKDRWYPALKELVSNINAKFSEAFNRIHCVGEVKIGEQEDYDKWSIDIWVKFRDSEQLQRLTGQRQSGGERALTTIFYLMSLTELARAPFSLVDEINQGMDQRYERAVHDNLVEVTCQEQSGQYFLITPKLLPNLKYNERMKILCVNNGEWLDDTTRNEKRYGDMRKMLEHKKYYPLASESRAPSGPPAIAAH